jgi:hypothetical protein
MISTLINIPQVSGTHKVVLDSARSLDKLEGTRAQAECLALHDQRIVDAEPDFQRSRIAPPLCL